MACLLPIYRHFVIRFFRTLGAVIIAFILILIHLISFLIFICLKTVRIVEVRQLLDLGLVAHLLELFLQFLQRIVVSARYIVVIILTIGIQIGMCFLSEEDVVGNGWGKKEKEIYNIPQP